jgi:hypothetical protein
MPIVPSAGRHWAEADRPDKPLIDGEALSAGSGFYIARDPAIAAVGLAHFNTGQTLKVSRISWRLRYIILSNHSHGICRRRPLRVKYPSI